MSKQISKNFRTENNMPKKETEIRSRQKYRYGHQTCTSYTFMDNEKPNNNKKIPKRVLTPKGISKQKKMFSQHFIDTVFKFIFNCN